MDIMELTELSLASNQCVGDKISYNGSSSSDHPSKKRKLLSDNNHHHLLNAAAGSSQFQTSVDLQVNDPLPLDWEQCLDLESGKMYYLNRKTLKKTWNLPKDQKLDLELNISPRSNWSDQCSSNGTVEESSKQQSSSSGTNMVALACLNCHLLVILSKTSPACPNCKYVHSLPALQLHAQPPKVSAIKSLNTLSLLN